MLTSNTQSNDGQNKHLKYLIDIAALNFHLCVEKQYGRSARFAFIQSVECNSGAIDQGQNRKNPMIIEDNKTRIHTYTQ